MTILGNIFLAIASILFLLFATSVLGKPAPRGGDAVMGYAWGIIIFYIVFLGCMAVAAIAIGSKGGFEWVSPSKGSQFWLVSLGLLTSVITAAFSFLSAGEPGARFLRLFSGFAPMLVPLVLIVGGLILLNDSWRTSLPALAYKIPLIGVFWLGIAGAGAGIAGWFVQSTQNDIRRLEGMKEDQERYHQGYLNDIDSCDVAKNMSRILVFTDANHDQDVRDRAVAKIKTNPKWQEELVRLLENQGAEEAFNFLASNEVDNKNLFPAAINTGVLSIADWIRREIKEAYQDHHLYDGQFSWPVERALRTIDKFEGMGVDYRPAVRELRAALDQEASVKKPKFQCAALLDSWIKRHP